MNERIRITVRSGALLSASRPPARLSRLNRTITTVAIRTLDRHLGGYIYEITLDSEPWLVVDSAYVTEHPSS